MTDYICDFGGSSFHEICLYDHFFTKNGFCDNGKGYNFANFEINGGESPFSVKEVEVYKVM